ncbi:hypothetical protein SAR11G3_00559 [Candidatus Pelagibacter sp. IMCC9063]|uniref:SxtJ family membrane protein n=1 Tax=Pelagibacter sp. (strain IMCC9063) TaxID=1002672 RepID=UPI0002046899|nr:SxtJ family membrane protein [Candidatus Pelagibacter sp. IMCC9063]AEA81034.1 hypothetical protein SAR11G3_00559 [Candidatus Pelagibacter sp. IMCC9063]
MKKDNIKVSSNRSFGLVFFIVFLIISTLPLFKGETIRIWSMVISFLFLVLGLLNSSILSPLNKLWFKFGILLGSFVSPIVMSLVFFTILSPISFVMKILGKNLLNLKKNNEKTYWIERSDIKSKMKNQF